MRDGARRKSRRGDLKMNAEINVTSLIDVAFTLLVIFIITAPVLQGGIEVRLPQGQVQPLAPTSDPFVLSILEGGTVVIGETPVPAEEFDEAFPNLLAAANPSAVYVSGDSLAIWGRVAPVYATVADAAREAGIPVRMIMQELPRR